MKANYLKYKIYIISIIIVLFLSISCSVDHSGYQLTKDELQKLESKAEHGDAEACWCLYIYYEEDKEKSIYWLRKGAKYGERRSQYLLGSLLLQEQSEKEIIEGLELLKKAAEQGDDTAQERLGEYYKDGKYISANLKKSEYWYRKSANQGSLTAMVKLSDILTANREDRVSLKEAYKWAAIALLRAGTGTSLNREIKQHQVDIVEKAKKANLNIITLKQEAEEQAKIENKRIPKYVGHYDPSLGLKCIEKAK
ncbi:MAG: tetratricopeptide repeat protein [Parabacteroides sp.]|nr:tetratricopeptide repeat protein [Parabacteroides sp.]